MRVLVACKRVIDYTVKVRVNAAKNAVEKGKNIKMSMNPFDEIAVEAGVKMKENKIAKEVIAVSIGPKQCQETIRHAFAMGADKGVHVQTDMETDLELQPLAVAKVLKEIVDREKPEMVIVGKQAIDDDSNQVGQMLSQLLGWPQATFTSELEVADNKESIAIVREVDGGLQHLNVPLPAVVTTDLRLNTPRYASLPNIMKARKKKIEILELDDLGVDVAPRIKILSVEEPPVREAGVKVESAEELVDKLKNEAKVI